MVVLYTSITGGYDSLRPVPGTYRAVCFTDRPIPNPGGWEIVEQPARLGSARYEHKRFKCCPHWFLDADISVWTDANRPPKGAPAEWAPHVLGAADIALFPHPDRHCAYREAESAWRTRRDEPGVIRAQADRYKADGFPRDFGLYVGGTVVRRHTPHVAAFNERWLMECLRGCVRDQVSLPYALWATGLTPAIIPEPYRDNPYVHHAAHQPPARSWKAVAETACGHYRASQDGGELADYLAHVAAMEPRTIVEVGTQHGGTLYAHLHVVPRGGTVLSVDTKGCRNAEGLDRLAAERGVTLRWLRGDSRDPAIIAQIAEAQPDVAFIDGDHSLEGVSHDFEHIGRLATKAVGFHDITTEREQVKDFWADVLPTYGGKRTEYRRRNRVYGIGVWEPNG